MDGSAVSLSTAFFIEVESQQDGVTAIAADGPGNAYVAGGTYDSQFPATLIATAAEDLFCCTVYNAAYSGLAADVFHGGTAPGIVTGVVQINCQVSASSGSHFIGARNRASKPVGIYTAP